MISKAVRYNKLRKVLADKKMSNRDLFKAVDTAPNTLTKLRRDDGVSPSVLRRICEHLGCDICDVCKFIPVGQSGVDAE